MGKIKEADPDLFSIAPPLPQYPDGVPHDVCDLFEKLTLQVKNSGLNHYSADAILHRIRWDHQVERGIHDFKANNNWTSKLSRWLMDKRPDLKGFFETRERRHDHAEI